MPPPKKPKSGPTTIEQFLSTDEIKKIGDGDVRKRTGSSSENSEVSDISELSMKSSEDSPLSDIKTLDDCDMGKDDTKSPGLKLLRELIIRKKEDEQRVPGCSSIESASPKSISPTMSSKFSANPCTDQQVVTAKAETEKKRPPSATSPISPLAGSVMTFGSFDKTMYAGAASAGGRRVDRIAGTLPPSGHTTSMVRTPTVTSYSSYFAPYMYGNVLSNSYNVFPDHDTEPRDLSLKLQKEKLSRDNRLYENSRLNEKIERDIQQRLSVHFGLNGFNNSLAEKNKEYLDARKNLVGILTEPRYNHLGFPVSNPMERDSTTMGSFPFFMNGLNSRRESVDKLIPKEEPHHPMIGNMVSQGGYLPIPHMMPTQAPSSTTLDFRDEEGRILPLLDPSLSFSDGRKLKEASASGSGPNKLCQVCNDNASGFHYGVWSCEGCKAFFKRSIQGPVDYVCPATNTCTIDKHRRKSCQACRLRKCYEVGMNKGSQRKERKGSLSMSKQSTKRSRADSSDNTVNSTSGSPNPAKNARRSQTAIILEALNKADLPILESYHNHSLPPTKVHLLNSLVKLAERELVHLINWAKNVPGYTDLSLSDQVHLIECCWMELLLLNCAFRSMEHEGKRLAFAPDLVLDRPLWNTVEMSEIFEQVAAVSEQLVHFHLHKDELLLLQATVLVNAEVRRLASYSQINNMRHALLDSIVDTAQKYHPDNLCHVPSVLLLLTHIRQAGERGIAYFQKLKNEGVVSFCDLLKEMLDAQDYMDKKSGESGE